MPYFNAILQGGSAILFQFVSLSRLWRRSVSLTLRERCLRMARQNHAALTHPYHNNGRKRQVGQKLVPAPTAPAGFIDPISAHEGVMASRGKTQRGGEKTPNTAVAVDWHRVHGIV